MRVGSIVALKKAHPCGGRKWKVIRTGADVKLRCMRCGREIWLPRSRLKRLMVKHGLQDKGSSSGENKAVLL